MCDVRKGTSTRKPRLNPDLVAAQQAQALTPPPFPLPGGVEIPTSSGGSPIPSSSKIDAYNLDEDEDLRTPVVQPMPSPSNSKIAKKQQQGPGIIPNGTKKNEAKKSQNK